MSQAERCQAWTWQGSDDPAALALTTLPMPVPQPGQALIRNAAIGLNPVDWKVLSGALVNWSAGQVPGVDGAGTVVAVGAGVDPAWLNRRVAYHQTLAGPGSFATHTPVAVSALMRLPDGLSFTAAAAVPCPALTAWQALEKLPTRPGRSLLIGGAGGSVGHYLAQFAAQRGLVVTALCHPRHAERLQALGVSQVLGGAESLSAPEAPPFGSYFAVIDAVSVDHAARLAPWLQANGHLVSIQDRVPQWPDPPFSRALSLHEVALGALHRFGDAQAWSELTAAGEAIFAALDQGTLQPETLERRPFTELSTLLAALRVRSFSGKAVVTL